MGTLATPHRRHQRRWLGPGIAAIIAIAALVAAGCSVSVGNTGLDTGEVEGLIVDGYETDSKATVEVACPDDIEPQADDTFTCEVTGPGGETADIEVRQVDDEGNVRWALVPVGLNPRALEAQIARELQQQGGVAADVDCPAGVVVEEGNVFLCEATAPNGDTARIEVVQQDDTGNVRWQVLS